MSDTTTTPFDPDFDAVYGITASGVIIPAGAPSLSGIYAPDVALSEGADVEHFVEWQCLTGHTGQYSYNGAVMHPSEQWGPWAVEHLARLADAPGVAFVAFAVVEVRDVDYSFPSGDPIGWAVAYQAVNA